VSIQPRLRKRGGRRVYDVRLRDPSGKVYTRTFDTKREDEALQDAERADKRGVDGSTLGSVHAIRRSSCQLA
jgi:hypothetical protein